LNNKSAKKSFCTIFQNENDKNLYIIIFASQPMRGKFYFGTSIVFLFMSFLTLLFVTPQAPTLWANLLHKPNLDFFFVYYTRFGEWPLIALSIAIALYKNSRLGLWFGMCFLLELLIVQGLKFGLNEPRPIQELGNVLFQAPNNAIAAWRSFPSGHTAGAFTALGFFAVISRFRSLEILYAILAALVGFSRLYLGQHYLHDVAAGICIALLIWLIFMVGKSNIRFIKHSTW
jgi:membrane-associated phospholipid phosphatase